MHVTHRCFNVIVLRDVLQREGNRFALLPRSERCVEGHEARSREESIVAAEDAWLPLDKPKTESSSRLLRRQGGPDSRTRHFRVANAADHANSTPDCRRSFWLPVTHQQRGLDAWQRFTGTGRACKPRKNRPAPTPRLCFAHQTRHWVACTIGWPALQPKAFWNSGMLETTLLTRCHGAEWGLVRISICAASGRT